MVYWLTYAIIRPSQHVHVDHISAFSFFAVCNIFRRLNLPQCLPNHRQINPHQHNPAKCLIVHRLIHIDAAVRGVEETTH